MTTLHDNGIYDVQVTHTPGHLTDHYNPANKTVNLSEGVYSSNSIMEINASKRALVWLSASGITNAFNHDKAEDALRSAAYTYVVAALGSLATLIYYVMIFVGHRDE